MMKKKIRSSLRILASLAMSLAVVTGLGVALAETTSKIDPKIESFEQPEAAAEALVTAVAYGDRQKMRRLFGPLTNQLLGSSDDAAIGEDRSKFLAAYREKHGFSPVGEYQVLLIGKDDWPLPIPLLQGPDKRWRFAAEVGLSELMLRRIGRNELNVLDICRVFYTAQKEYYQRNPENLAVKQYARRLISQTGKKDGLYWPDDGVGQPSPLGELLAAAEASKKQSGTRPYHGYYYKILTSQGPQAPGGAWKYLENDQMIGGFGLLAYPAEYGRSGVMSFIINQSGRIYEKDLGPQSAAMAAKMSVFNPDSSWKEVVESEEPPK